MTLNTLIKSKLNVIAVSAVVFLSSTLPLSANAQPARPPNMYPVGKPNLDCIYDSARYHRVPFQVLLAVNSIERGHTGQAVGNTDGTHDNGAFQINSIHFPRAKKLVRATPYDISNRGCFNAEFAAMLLSEAITHPKKQYEDFFTRASGYHSWTPRHNRVYKEKLVRYTREWTEWLNKQGLGHTMTPIGSSNLRL